MTEKVLPDTNNKKYSPFFEFFSNSFYISVIIQKCECYENAA